MKPTASITDTEEVEEVAEPTYTANYTVTTSEEGLTHIKFYFRGYIDQLMAGTFIETMNWWDAQFPESSWEIIISSPGGEISYGTAIYSVLRSYSLTGGGEHHVLTRVAGYAASAAALIFQAGDDRAGTEIDMLMLHEPMCSFTDDTPTYIRSELRQADMWLDRFADLCLERCTLTREEFLAAFAGKDWWVPMEQAVEIGLADRTL